MIQIGSMYERVCTLKSHYYSFTYHPNIIIATRLASPMNPLDSNDFLLTSRRRTTHLPP
jgi:hypothetical protein